MSSTNTTAAEREAERMQAARNVLRLDGTLNDEILLRLVRALPSYIEQATGLTEEEQADEPQCRVAEDFIIQLWYMPEQIDVDNTRRIIDSLLSSIRMNRNQASATN